MLKIENISKKFKKVQALDEVNAQLNSPGCIGLVGPNGAGKTTLFNAIAGLIKLNSGEISYKDKPICQWQKKNRSIGYFLQDFKFNENRTLLEELTFLSELAGLSTDEQKLFFRNWINKLKLKDYASRKIKSLSFGTVQKMNFLQAILGDPEIVLLDEPFSGLDISQKKEIKKHIKSFKKGLTIISSHNLNDLEDLCSHYLFIKQGRAIKFLKRDTLKSSFLKIESSKQEAALLLKNLKNIRDSYRAKVISKEDQKATVIIECLQQNIPDIQQIKSDLSVSGNNLQVRPNMEDIYEYMMRQ